MINRKITVLGSTGSVGRQTMEVAAFHHLTLDGIAAHGNIRLLEEQIRRFSPRYCAVADEAAASELRVLVADTPVEILSGPDSAVQLAALTDAELVFNSLSGFAGLRPTLAAIESGHDVALSNKETMVTAGELVNAAAQAYGVSIHPVDSEHCAIAQCLEGKRAERLLLTASGGPFFGYTPAQLRSVRKEDALRHPNWSMGAKITIDSATMMNKGLEVIEAARLFGMDADRIDVVVHRESIVHSMVEFADHAVLAQLSVPDMRLCIQYALTGESREAGLTPRLSLPEIGKLTFFAPDMEAFPLLELAYRALRMGGIAPTVLNGVNEIAVALFLEDKIGFADIAALDIAAFDALLPEADSQEPLTLERIDAADRLAREEALALARSL